jgi:hypothetical protein
LPRTCWAIGHCPDSGPVGIYCPVAVVGTTPPSVRVGYGRDPRRVACESMRAGHRAEPSNVLPLVIVEGILPMFH